MIEKKYHEHTNITLIRRFVEINGNKSDGRLAQICIVLGASVEIHLLKSPLYTALHNPANDLLLGWIPPFDAINI
jgi:hypothetical protein